MVLRAGYIALFICLSVKAVDFWPHSEDYKSWISFHDLFDSLIHKNSSLSAVQKLHYLKSNLDGEAQLLIRHFAISEANYSAAWEMLVERYNNKRALANAQIKTLLSQSSLSFESANGIKSLLDTTRECLQALKNMDVDTNSWDAIIIYMTVQKLPKESHELWEQQIGSDKDLPTFKDLCSFLETRFRTLEAIGCNKSKTQRDALTKITPKPVFKNTHSFHVTNTTNCPLCSKSHAVRHCPKFLRSDTETKNAVARKHRLCINCLATGHSVSNCPSVNTCQHCHKRHHTFLHINFRKSSGINIDAPSFTPNEAAQVTSSETTVNTYFTSKKQTQVLLATALVRISSPLGGTQILRALLDQGSQASFMTEAAAQLLKLQKHSISVTITALGNAKTENPNAKVNFNIRSLHDDHITIPVRALVLRKLTNVLPVSKVNYTQWEHLKGITLADPTYAQPGRIDLLLGADVYSQIIQEGVRHGRGDAPVAQRTSLGWILSGKISVATQDDNNSPDRHFITLLNTIDLEKSLQQFWELEEVPHGRILTEDDKACEKFFDATHIRDHNGQYIVRLPFKHQQPVFGKSRDNAISRLIQMERRFNRNPSLREQYSECLKEYLHLGHMTIAETSEEYHRRNSDMFSCCYLPHHAVVKESSTTTKLRVVFDASAKTASGESLNDSLLTGPTIQEDMTALLLRWRRFKVAFTADVEKMYRQIRVHQDDIKYQRIVWRKGPDEHIKDYQLRTVTFGMSSAPYLAIKSLHQLAKDEQEQFPIAAETTLNDFYVDDLLSGADDVEEAISKQTQLISLLKTGKFVLRKWVSNSAEVLEHIPAEHREISPAFNINIDQNVKALGVLWYPADDIFTFKVLSKFEDIVQTKRELLSNIAKLFDPLGWVAPVIIKAKVMMQEVWLQGLGWDEKLPVELRSKWVEFRRELRDLESIRIPRWTGQHHKQKSCELHGFSDASTKAYSAVVYLKVFDIEGKCTITLLMSKTKVAPMKTISVPRLELCGAVLLARLMRHIKEATKLEAATTQAWTDSEIVLSWVRGHPSKWKTFVANRVSEIRSLLGSTSWRYVASEENPADCATRGLCPKGLVSHRLWWNGPKWLQFNEESWPKRAEVTKTNLELKRVNTFQVNIMDKSFPLFEKCSTLGKLLRSMAYLLRFVFNCSQTKTKCKERWITTEELTRAKQYLIRMAQTEEYADEMRQIRNGKEVNKKSSIFKLNAFLDSSELLRVGGRLKNANISFEERHPYILPKRHRLTYLIVQQMHHDTLHGGTNLMIGLLRKRYWIVNVRNVIRHQIYKCVICHRQKAATRQQLMGDLPSPRVNMSRPFTHTGVDYCGPLDIRCSKSRGTKTFKGYIALFICLSVKAVHLEAVSDLSTQGFLATFRRFTSRRGLPSDMYSDCGSNFIGANAILTRDTDDCFNRVNKEIAEALAIKGVKWHFIPPAAPHMGGLWESNIKATKTHLRKILGNSVLTYEELSTVLTQIEACLNSRPLYALNEDPEDLSSLTPGHFLVGNALLTPPEPSLLDLNIHRLDRWQFIQRLYQDFWNQWSRDYLGKLQQRPKWAAKKGNAKVGDIVIVKDERLPPCRWLLAKIMKIHPGSDGLVRVVTLRTKDTTIKRPISKISTLPINDEQQLELN